MKRHVSFLSAPHFVSVRYLVYGVVIGAAIAWALASNRESDRIDPEFEAIESPNVVARVNNRVIRIQDVERELQRLRGRAEPRDVLDQLILRQAQVSLANEQRLVREPDLARQVDGMIIGALRERELVPLQRRNAVPEAQVQAVYQAESAKYTTPAKMRLAVLRLEVPATASETKRTAARKRLADAVAEAAHLPPETRGFGAIAIRNSDDQSTRYKGGDVGWLVDGRPSRWAEPIVAAGRHLTQIREISPIVELDSGMAVVMLLDQAPASTTEYSLVAPAIRKRLRNDLVRMAQQEWERDLLNRVDVRVFESAFSRVKAPKTPEKDARPPNMR